MAKRSDMTDIAHQAQFAAFRRLFPAAQEQVYCDVAARGPISTTVRDAVAAHLDVRMSGRVDKQAYFDLIETTRDRFAGLINAHSDEISFTKNVSDGINTVANALPWQAGDNVVICQSLEHPANIFVWQSLAQTRGIVVREVAPVDNAISADAVLNAIDDRTRVVTVSSVSFSPGLRVPMARLGRVCRERGIFFLVDGAQSIGIARMDVAADMIDGLAVSTQKGLLGLYGMGFLFVRRELAEAMRPAYLSRMGVDLGTAHEASSGTESSFRFATAARRFDVGNFNYVGAVAVNQAMKELQAFDAVALESYVCGLARQLASKLEAVGAPLIAKSNDPRMAHIVAIGHGIGATHDSVDDTSLLALHDQFEAGRICHTIRRGVLRLSLHAYNDLTDIDRIADIAGRWVKNTALTIRAAG